MPQDKFQTFNEKSLPDEIEELYGNLNMEDIRDEDYMHAKIICKDFKIKIFR